MTNKSKLSLVIIIGYLVIYPLTLNRQLSTVMLVGLTRILLSPIMTIVHIMSIGMFIILDITNIFELTNSKTTVYEKVPVYATDRRCKDGVRYVGEEYKPTKEKRDKTAEESKTDKIDLVLRTINIIVVLFFAYLYFVK